MVESVRIQSKGNHTIGAHLFIPEKSNQTILVINSAMAVLQKYYFDFAESLASEGFHVITYDYFGIGESRPGPIENIKTSIVQWAQKDYAAVIEYAKSKFENHRLLVLGHSVGGQIVGMSKASLSVDSFMLVASQTPYWPKYGFQFKIMLLWYFLIPVLTPLFGFFPARKMGLFEDLPKDVALQWMRCAKSEHYIFGELPQLKPMFESITQSMKVISLSDDPYAPLNAVNDLLKYYPSAEIDHLHIHPKDIKEKHIGHFGFFRKRFASTLWRSATEWLGNSGKLVEAS